MTKLLEQIKAFALAGVVFLGSLIISPMFFKGDQEHYRKFYDGVSGLSISDAFQFYSNSLGSSEPGYFVLAFLFSGFIGKDFFIALANFLFSYLVFLWMFVNRVRLYVAVLVLFNYYFLVLLFSAERLKFSLLFFLLAFATGGLVRYFSLGFSFLTHVQVAMVLFSTASDRIFDACKRFLNARVGLDFVILSVLALFGFIVALVLADHILQKYNYYAGLGGGWVALLKPTVLALLAVYYARDEWPGALLASFPMILASFFVGSERVVIFSYFVFMFYALRYNGGSNVGVIASLVYFMYKGLLFLHTANQFGDGFHGVAAPTSGA